MQVLQDATWLEEAIITTWGQRTFGCQADAHVDARRGAHQSR